jgi:hypothetical protein
MKTPLPSSRIARGHGAFSSAHLAQRSGHASLKTWPRDSSSTLQNKGPTGPENDN